MHKFEVNKTLNYTIDQVYNLIIDVDKYHEFLPWCGGSRIVEEYDDYFIADMVIKFKLYSEKYRSKVLVSPPKSGVAEIDVDMIEGPFRYLTNCWKLVKKQDKTEVSFFVDFRFKSSLLDKMVGLVFESACKRMIEAFEERADKVYGRDGD